ncbi:protelomerase family protein [Floridanema evergladense]|uniref:Protelomerase family protein n=1 Tax=Floridaenema evergladense BLCC-F167 TaxID=3153639 RepID=A0ABV4WFZ9_9CYAN
MSRQLKHPDELTNEFIEWRVSELLPKLEALAPYNRTNREKGVKSEGLIGWKDLVTKEAALLKANYPDDRPEDQKEYGTCLRQITILKKELKKAAKTELLDKANYNPVCTIITHFGNALSFLFSPYKEKQNVRYRESVKTRSKVENRIFLNLSPYLIKAKEVLTQVANGATLFDVEWRDVSCAIALATGRRMAEVHLSAKLRKIGDYELGFTGQLKGKSRKLDGQKLRDFEFAIPTLLSSDLVLAGIEFLEQHDKRFPATEDPERVNRRWSKVLNEQAKDWAIIEDMTYHKFRGAYLKACIANSGIDPFDYLDYARAILGDNDEATIKAYQRFEIKQGSITKL